MEPAGTRRRKLMAVADDIATERQRLTERLARIDAERQKLAELEAAERVLSRMAPAGKATARRGRRAKTGEASGVAPTGAPGRCGRRAKSVEAMDIAAGPTTRRGRTGRGRGSPRAKPEVSLADPTLRAVEALGNEVSAEQIREYLGRELGMQVRAKSPWQGFTEPPARRSLTRGQGAVGARYGPLIRGAGRAVTRRQSAECRPRT